MSWRSYLSLTKPRVVVLLQITALCAVLVHDRMEGQVGMDTAYTMLIVFVGGYLSAGGANAINMWYDRDIDPMMTRTEGRPIPSGEVSSESALALGVLLSISGVSWFWILSNEIAAFWSAFSILFYVFIYSIWLKRSTPQNIVIGGIAGSTPPVIAWSAAEDGLAVSTKSANLMLDSLVDIGSPLPWLMFLLIFLWTPPHFWALALYRSEEYGRVGVPMMPNVKGPERTLIEMKVYAVILILMSLVIPSSYGGLEENDTLYYILGCNVVGLSIWYASSVWRIDLGEECDETGRMPTAARSFFISMLYLALMFVVLVTASFGTTGSVFGACISLFAVVRSETRR
ncbi:MAG: protoheme IX farnesyltransferase [Euryarchaeota archaeon]|uniref:Protoheme IX farnesyltransferase n=1 Tax=uncultured marine group II/III euryarchaeote AD1000_12_F09 TaxID=1457727 RepID=A0A075FJR4_9EURY|nr:heme O synthase (cyoE) [uncultured marine group II/III euryarchaeote AD1000_12_F09]MAQ57272.1 protoheme IX farnesyltransferase [Euryarchaeota archaeon]